MLLRTTMGQKVQPRVKLLASCREQSRLNMTHPHDMSFQGTHIAHSDGRVVTMLPTPCTVADQHAGSPRRPPGRSGMLRPADNGRAWHRQADKRPAWGYPYHHLPCQRNPRKGKGRPGDLKDSLSRSPLFSCCNPCFPLAYKRESKAPH